MCLSLQDQKPHNCTSHLGYVDKFFTCRQQRFELRQIGVLVRTEGLSDGCQQRRIRPLRPPNQCAVAVHGI